MDRNTLYTLMQQSGLAASDIASRIGVTRQQVNAWLRGARPIPPAYHDKLRVIAEEYGGSPPPVIHMTQGAGGAYAIDAETDRLYQQLLTKAQAKFREIERKTGRGWALIFAHGEAQEIWCRTGRAVDPCRIWGMSEAEIERRQWLTAQRAHTPRGGGLLHRLFEPRREAALPAPAIPAAGDTLMGYNLFTGRLIVSK